MQKITGAAVVSSSGCHRYGYWNEQYLFDDRPNTGWCTPSRTIWRGEYLEFVLPYKSPVCGIGMLSRNINADAGFPVSFTLSVSEQSGAWAPILDVTQISNRPGTWHRWDFPTVTGDTFRIDFREVNRRPEGKYFLQFMSLEIYSA